VTGMRDKIARVRLTAVMNFFRRLKNAVITVLAWVVIAVCVIGYLIYKNAWTLRYMIDHHGWPF
jgi:hypothetical protein